MKLLSYKFLLILIYFLSTVISYSDDKPAIKNLIIHNKSKKVQNIQFKNNYDQNIKLEEFKGKLLILNFWATWCIPCRDEMPSLDKLQSLDSFSNLKVFPINVGKEKKEKAEKFFEEYKIKYLEIYIDESVNLANKFNLRGLPTTVIINKEGKEFARIVGGIDFSDKKFINWLKKYN